MPTTALARYGAPIAIVAGTLMIITRLVLLITTPTETGPLKAYVLTTTHAVSSVVSILAFALLVIALVALYDREARSFGGFAHPQLQTTGMPLIATLIVAVIVAGWHAPLLFVVGMRLVELLSTVAVTFWYAWLFDHAGESVLITIVSHVAQGSIEHSDLWSAGADASRLEYLYAAVASATVAGLLYFDWEFWQSTGSSHGQPEPTGQRSAQEPPPTTSRRSGR